MKFFYSFLAVLVAVVGLSQSAPTSLYASCDDKSALCFGLGGSTSADKSCLSDHSCTFFFSSKHDASGFHFALVAPKIAADRFIAVAFSGEQGMAGLVAQCYHSGSKNTLEYSFNTEGKHANEKITNQKEVTGFSNPSVSYDAGALVCTFSTKAEVAYKTHKLDFVKNAYYIKIATGPFNATSGNIEHHSTHDGSGRLASATSVSLASAKGVVAAKDVPHKPASLQAAPAASGLYEGCKAKTALCFGVPADCSATENCAFFFKSVYSSGSGFTLSLVAPKMAADTYIAVAFSSQPKMSGLVVQCLHSGSSNPMQFAFNNGTDHQTITQSQVSGFSHEVATFSNGELKCQWNVPAGTKVVYKDNTFDFEKDSYYVKIATGPVKDGAMVHHVHDGTGRLVSKAPLSLKSTGTVHF